MSRPRGPEPAGHRPLYARMLRLKFLRPSGFLCFVFLEGSVALGILLALAELVSWWGVLVLPATVAIMVKLNDVIAGSLTPPPPPVATPRAVREHAHASALRPAGPPGVGEGTTTRLPGVIDGAGGVPIKRPWVERVERAEARQQWMRQSATRRYE
jgi:hypothetical protein